MAKKKEEEVVVSTEKSVETVAKLFPVVDSTGMMVRTYSVEIHGEDAGKLAKQFATKIGGKVL